MFSSVKTVRTVRTLGNHSNLKVLSTYIPCTQVYLDNRDASAFTWYPANGGICVLFDEAVIEEDCVVDCFSFDYNDDLKCHQMEGACAKGQLISE